VPEHYTEEDKPRLAKQLDVVREFMLEMSQNPSQNPREEVWLTLQAIANVTGFPQASVSADLRHLRKAVNGGYKVEKRRRGDRGGLWEYRVTRRQERAA